MAQIATIGNLTGDEQTVITAIAAGTYFHHNETPTGTIDGVNDEFTLAANPNPDASLEVRLNGQILRSGAGNDYTLSGTTLTMLNVPQPGDTLTVSYIVSPI